MLIISRGGPFFTMHISWCFQGVDPLLLCMLMISRGGTPFTTVYLFFFLHCSIMRIDIYSWSMNSFKHTCSFNWPYKCNLTLKRAQHVIQHGNKDENNVMSDNSKSVLSIIFIFQEYSASYYARYVAIASSISKVIYPMHYKNSNEYFVFLFWQIWLQGHYFHISAVSYF